MSHDDEDAATADDDDAGDDDDDDDDDDDGDGDDDDDDDDDDALPMKETLEATGTLTFQTAKKTKNDDLVDGEHPQEPSTIMIFLLKQRCV